VTSIESVPRRPGSAEGRLRNVVVATRRWALRGAIAAAAAATVIVYAIVRGGFPGGASGALAVVGVVAVLTPPVILLAFWLALGELVRLPERLRRLPLEAREHGEQLRSLLDSARSVGGSRFGLARIVWRTTRAASAARETLTPYAPLLPLVSVPFLVATAVAAIAAAVEVVAACAVAVALVAS
jgi:hypothetical protein